MASSEKPQLGALPPKHSFMLNPYPEQRISRCPVCEKKTGQRKTPLLIHVDPRQLIALNYTCRYCPVCDLLIAHKHEIEHLLTGLFRRLDPDAIGNRYLVMGTVEKSVWREGLTNPKAVNEMLAYSSDFARNYPEMRLTRGGYYRNDQEPPIWEPDASQEWVKGSADSSRG